MNEFSIPLMLLLRSLFSLFLKIVGFLQSRRLKYSFVSALAQSFRSSSSSSSSLYLFFLLDDGDGHQQHKTTTLIWDDDFCERNRVKKNLRIFKTLNTPVLSVFFSFSFRFSFLSVVAFLHLHLVPSYLLSLSLSLSQKRRNAKSGGRVFENVVVFFFSQRGVYFVLRRGGVFVGEEEIFRELDWRHREHHRFHFHFHHPTTTLR